MFAERPRTVGFNFIADGDFVAVEARGDNVTKTGLRYDNQYCMVYRIENGKIKEIKEYCDFTLVERVLGPFPRVCERLSRSQSPACDAERNDASGKRWSRLRVQPSRGPGLRRSSVRLTPPWS